MFCSNCGAKLEEDAKFCGNCGQTVPLAATLAGAQTASVEPPPAAPQASVNVKKKEEYHEISDEQKAYIQPPSIGDAMYALTMAVTFCIAGWLFPVGVYYLYKYLKIRKKILSSESIPSHNISRGNAYLKKRD